MNKTRLLCLFVATCLMGLTAGAQSVVKNKAYYEAITYSWQNANGATVTSKLTDKATDPYQIIALLEAVYGDARVPGPYYSAWGEWSNQGSWLRPNYVLDTNVRTDEVTYGTVTAGGWNVTATRPQEEGYTVLLVAVKNSFDPDLQSHRYAGSIRTKAELAKYIEESVDYVQLLTDGMRVGSGLNAGTMFAIQGKLNRFFFLSKGQARKMANSSYMLAPFSNMFEQFSPTNGETGDQTQNLTDFYDKMVKGETYPIMHDCNSVLEVAHYFSMSGREGTTAYDMTGLQLFVPDYRLAWWGETSTRNGRITGYSDSRDMNSVGDDSYAQYGFYNTEHLPWTFLYTIKASADAQPHEAEHTYQVNLSWTSSIDELSGEHVDQVYDLHRVVDGVVEPTPVATGLTDTTWSETVPQKTSGYALSYMVKGKPVKATYNPIQSNIVTVAIPGYDPLERMKLNISGDYRSRYDYDSQVNDYTNTVVLNNGVGTSVSRNHLMSQPELTVMRMVPADSTKNTVAATIKISNVGTSSCDYTLTYANQNVAKEPVSGKFNFDENGEIDFSNFTITDNFSADVSQNAHPSKYVYQVVFTSAVPVLDENGEAKTEIYSNTISVPVYKTETAQIAGYSADEVESDVYRPDDAKATIGLYDAKHMGISFDVHDNPSVFRYYTTRNGEEYGQAQRRSDGHYVVSATLPCGTYEQMELVTFASNENVKNVDVRDQCVDDCTSGSKDYGTVIETFLPSTATTDKNTYGTDRHQVQVVDITAKVTDQEMSNYAFTIDGKPARYYRNTLDVSIVAPKNYELTKVRVWRKTADSVAMEQDEQYYWRLDQVSRPDEITFFDGSVESFNYPVVPGLEPTWDATSGVLTVHDYFGAADVKKLATGKFDAQYYVRAYFKMNDGTYALDQAQLAAPFDGNIPTGLADVWQNAEVQSVTYFNAQGLSAKQPFEGLNIVKTTYSNGNVVTCKKMFFK